MNIQNATVAVQSPVDDAEVLKQKVLAVTKIMQMYKTLRNEQENLHKLKQLSPNQKLPHGILRSGPKAIKDAINSFNATKEADTSNEAMPDNVLTLRHGTMFSDISEEEQLQMLVNTSEISSSGLLFHSRQLAVKKKTEAR